MKPLLGAGKTFTLLTAFLVSTNLYVAPAAASVVYFLVGERSIYHKDSYVLPLTRPEDVTEARRLLREVSIDQRPSVGARLAPGSDGINRDHLAVGAPQWSWHVAEFTGFFVLGTG